MADVRRFVRIDVGVLDDDFAVSEPSRRACDVITQFLERVTQHDRSIQIEIDIAGTGDLDLADSRRSPRSARISSSATAFGAFFSFFASSKQTGVASSPISIFGVWFRTMSGGSIFHSDLNCGAKRVLDTRVNVQLHKPEILPL